MEIKSFGVLRIVPCREIKTGFNVSANEVTVKGLSDFKKYKFDKIFDKDSKNQEIWDYMCRGQNSIVSGLLSGVSSSIVTYGEVNAGKSFMLYGRENGLDMYLMILNEIFSNYTESLSVSIWEIVYVQSDRTEQIVDLLKISDFKPLPSNLTQDFISVEINNEKEGEYVLECAKELSSNWELKPEGGYKYLNNRSHFFIRINLRNSFIHIADLAGALPSNPSPEMRVKLGSDEQLNYTRIGLNQYRNIIWELLKTPKISFETLTSSRKSKLALVISSILTTSKTYYFTAIKEDSVYEDIIKNLDVLQRSQSIQIVPLKNNILTQIVSIPVFIKRHKAPKYWNPKLDSFDSQKKQQDNPRNALKQQISQMILELDETPILKENPNDTIIYNSFNITPEIPDYKPSDHIHEHDILEIQAQYQLEIENLKLENCSLRQKLRIIQENSDFLNIFNLYEEEIKKLENQVKGLRQEFVNNINSVQKFIEISDNTNDDEILILQKKFKSSVKDLNTLVKNLECSLSEKEKENFELKKNERKWQTSRKCFENMTRKSLQLENTVGKQTKHLQSNQNTFQEMIEELETLNKDNEKLKKENKNLLNANERMAEELVLMKEIASTSGMPEETLKRIHKNLSTPIKTQGEFLVSLIHRLQQDIPDKKFTSFIDNIIHEINNLIQALQQSQIREKNLVELLIELQKHLDKTDTGFTKETNKVLRRTLLSQLTS
jgi:Kinesin motor domain